MMGFGMRSHGGPWEQEHKKPHCALAPLRATFPSGFCYLQGFDAAAAVIDTFCNCRKMRKVLFESVDIVVNGLQ